MGPTPLESYGNQMWSIMNDFLLTSIPLFVLLGEILLRSGVTDRMYKTLSLWLAPLPGGLLHTNIGASSIFAAVSGSSVATAATISTVALPEFRKRRYNEKLVLILELMCCAEVLRMIKGELKGNVKMGLVLHATR